MKKLLFLAPVMFVSCITPIYNEEVKGVLSDTIYLDSLHNAIDSIKMDSVKVDTMDVIIPIDTVKK